jgi:serine/threonine-protein kinase RsbW
MELELALSLPRDARSVPAARQTVRSALWSIGVQYECAEDIETALTEGVSNVLRHASPACRYQVRLRLDDERCVLRLLEAGARIEPAVAQRDTTTPDGDHVLPRMRALADQVHFEERAEPGTIVRLEKRLTYVDRSLRRRSQRGPLPP